jgi:hypothetical protein
MRGKFSLSFDIAARVLDKYTARLLVRNNPILQIQNILVLFVYVVILSRYSKF